MHDNVNITLPGFAKYKGKGFYAFILHRISGLGTILFLTLHITTTATVFFAPQWYDVLVEIFRNPIIMIAEIILAFFVIYHGVNGLRIAYVEETNTQVDICRLHCHLPPVAACGRDIGLQSTQIWF